MKIYLVGGAVRDKLLQRDVTERDYVVVGSTPEEMLAKHFKPVGKDFPVFLHPKTKEEYALARTERKTSAGYTGFTFHAAPEVTLEQDLARRDLTINAIAEDEQGHLIDPFNGQKDLQLRLLRHVSPAFVEDPVRILRLARFAARFHYLNFTIAPETMTLMKTMVANGEVNALVPERVWQEWQRALTEQDPEIFIQVLHDCGALKILLPEIERLFGTPQNKITHPEIDTGIHTLMVLKQAALLTTDPVTRFAASMHDVGKGITPAEYLPKHPMHEENGVPLVEQICERLRIPRIYRDLAVLVTRYHGLGYKIMEQERKDPEDIINLFECLDVFRRPERLQQFRLACLADVRGRPGFENQPDRSEFLEKLFIAAKNVRAHDLGLTHLSGEAIKEAVREARKIAISNML
ncbi:MAG: multifunctional CCA addition/repair protein [Gammaproteobacteria bacterium]